MVSFVLGNVMLESGLKVVTDRTTELSQGGENCRSQCMQR